MDSAQDSPLPTIIFEHACKQNFKDTIQHILDNEAFISKIPPNMSKLDEIQIKPVFILIFLLKKIYSSNILVKIDSLPELMQLLPVLINLLETTFRQYSFISLKKYFTFISELKLLDLMSLIVRNSESSPVVQKLNQYFPRWTLAYRTAIETDFSIDNSKILEKVEESHTQCRRLVLKLAVDQSYRTKYMCDQYTHDMSRIAKESREYIKETVNALQSYAGSSLLETIAESEENHINSEKDLGMQLLFEYIQPEITDESLVKFLEDFEPTLNSQPTTGLASCLLPFDSMSEEEDSDVSDSEYECSQSGSQQMNSQEMKTSDQNGF